MTSCSPAYLLKKATLSASYIPIPKGISSVSPGDGVGASRGVGVSVGTIELVGVGVGGLVGMGAGPGTHPLDPKMMNAATHKKKSGLPIGR